MISTHTIMNSYRGGTLQVNRVTIIVASIFTVVLLISVVLNVCHACPLRSSVVSINVHDRLSLCNQWPTMVTVLKRTNRKTSFDFHVAQFAQVPLITCRHTDQCYSGCSDFKKD